jgi:hypothetical protein
MGIKIFGLLNLPVCFILICELLLVVLSRGRGIKVYNKISQIIDHVLNRDNPYIAQKYIEKPLIILRRKVN